MMSQVFSNFFLTFRSKIKNAVGLFCFHADCYNGLMRNIRFNAEGPSRFLFKSKLAIFNHNSCTARTVRFRNFYNIVHIAYNPIIGRRIHFNHSPLK